MPVPNPPPPFLNMQLGLEDLRSRLTIIPQDPVLYSGMHGQRRKVAHTGLYLPEIYYIWRINGGMCPLYPELQRKMSTCGLRSNFICLTYIIYGEAMVLQQTRVECVRYLQRYEK